MGGSAGEEPRGRVMAGGGRFPRPIVLPRDIDGGKRWGGTQGSCDGCQKRFPTLATPGAGYQAACK